VLLSRAVLGSPDLAEGLAKSVDERLSLLSRDEIVRSMSAEDKEHVCCERIRRSLRRLESPTSGSKSTSTPLTVRRAKAMPRWMVLWRTVRAVKS